MQRLFAQFVFACLVNVVEIEILHESRLKTKQKDSVNFDFFEIFFLKFS